MTKNEYNEAAALVVRLRKDLELHTDALIASNAHCEKLLVHNEMLAADRATLYAELQSVIAERDKEYEAGTLTQTKLAETTKDLAYSRLAVDTMRARDKRFTETIAKCGAAAGEDIGDFIERAVACRDQFHRELVEVRAALASATEQRDSLKRTLDEWERADTKPHTRIDEVAQVVPVCMQCLKERIETAHAYETGPSVAILTKPLLPDDVADHVVPPVLPLCMKCHGCGFVLETDSRPGALYCMNFKCDRTNTADTDSPYNGPCNSAVRHE